MKKLLLTAMVGLSVLMSACGSSSSERSEAPKTPDVIEEKMIERVKFAGRSRDFISVLTTDGSFYSGYINLESKALLAEKGDTVIIKNGKFFGFKFAMSK